MKLPCGMRVLTAALLFVPAGWAVSHSLLADSAVSARTQANANAKKATAPAKAERTYKSTQTPIRLVDAQGQPVDGPLVCLAR